MKQVILGVTYVFVLAVFSVLSLGLGPAVTPAAGMKHSIDATHQMNVSNCYSICTIATAVEDEIKRNLKDEDDKPQPPLYVRLQISILTLLKQQHSQQAKLAVDREPPPGGAPVYISLTVFRA